MKDLGLNRGDLRIMPYNEEWTEAFKVEKTRIEELDLGEVLSLHHIGSTAVPGLSAKPIIDVMIGIKAKAHERVASHIVDLDFERGGFLYTKADFLLFKSGEPRTHILHLVEQDSREFLNKIGFRDLLRESEKDRNAYDQLKTKVSRRFPGDRKRYGELKSHFIQSRLSKLTKDTS